MASTKRRRVAGGGGGGGGGGGDGKKSPTPPSSSKKKTRRKKKKKGRDSLGGGSSSATTQSSDASSSSSSSDGSDSDGGDDSDDRLESEVSSLSYADLCSRKDAIRNRLDVISVELPGARKKKGGAKRARQIAAARAAAAAAAAEAAKAAAAAGDGGGTDGANGNAAAAAAGASSAAAAASAAPLPPPPPVPFDPKTDVHWDYVLKEMMWLGADFQSERKSHRSSSTRLASAVKQFHRTKESRRMRELAEFESKRRRLAGRIGREVVRGWWGSKIDRVALHKARAKVDEARRRAMDRQLVHLVKQTEKYGRSLAEQGAGASMNGGEAMNGAGEEDGSGHGRDKADAAAHDLISESDGDVPLRCRRSGRRRPRTAAQTSHSSNSTARGGGMTIEEALAAAESSSPSARRARRSVGDYAQVAKTVRSDDELYGESIHGASSEKKGGVDGNENDEDDGEYLPDESDDEGGGSDMEVDGGTVDADAEDERAMEEEAIGYSEDEREEVRKLAEEGSMDVEDVIRRLVAEAEGSTFANLPGVGGEEEKTEEAAKAKPETEPTSEGGGTDESTPSRSGRRETRRKKVSFAPTPNAKSSGNNSKGTAASDDVEDHYLLSKDDDGADDDDGEFESAAPEVDDETTIEAEERMGREMSYEDEIALLERENEMSVEELRAMYAGMDEERGGEKGKAEEEKDDNLLSSSENDEEGASLASMDDEEDDDDDGEFESAAPEVDDETTIEAEERMGREMSYEDEIAMLNRENEMSVEELRAMYAGMDQEQEDEEEDEDEDDEESEEGEKDDDEKEVGQREKSGAAAAATMTSENQNENGQEDGPSSSLGKRSRRRRAGRGKASDSGSVKGEGDGGGVEDEGGASEEQEEEDDEEFESAAPEADDETTIEAEERMGREMSYEDEIAMLNRENEMSIEELRAMYAGMDQEEDGEEAEEEKEEEGNKDGTETGNSADSAENGQDGRSSSLATRRGRRGKIISYGSSGGKGGGDEDDDDEGGEGSVEGGGALAAVANSLGDNDDAEEDEFLPQSASAADDNDAVDDETTLEAEERMGREMTPEQELDMLRREGERPIEELLEMHAEMERRAAAEAEAGAGDDEKQDEDEDENEGEGEGESKAPADEGTSSVDEADARAAAGTKRKRGEGGDGNDESLSSPADPSIKRLKSEGDEEESRPDGKDEEGDGDGVLLALTKSEERARSTMVSVPYVLSSWVKMREYQRIGLNWLVSIQTRRLNGILADEMGLGKTLQTISLLSYLACYKGVWGPHLVIVPTSCIVNWEMELKRFCPALKVLCYYGTAKRRKELRVGWTKSNWYHVVVTSYQLAVQDAFAFKRKKWYYLILDEAQNIKNFQSQRWQTLVNFNTQRRLLLTGTPLQNNLMELWSLLHFLMPHIFRSRKEFSYWFSNPMNSIVEGNAARNDDLIGRLHGIIRPFVLRRLKKDVETQMPGKYEHIVKCQMSRRQMFLYEEFMARSSTRMALQKGGNYMGMMNVLMQLRKVCNHPDLFEPRTVITPFFMEPLNFATAACVVGPVGAAESGGELLSSRLVHPLWSGPCGLPSFDAAISHDDVRAEQLARLETPPESISGRVAINDIIEPRPDKSTPPGLATLLNEIRAVAEREKQSIARRHSVVNSQRCRSRPFACSHRTLDAVRIFEPTVPKDDKVEDLAYGKIASTPSELLSMKRSQQRRADDLDEVLKKFVFCVPRAGARKPRLVASKVDLASRSDEARLSSSLMTPLETHFRPFRTSNARLTSFFPDKKLVQFDAGKLQALSVLMADLKRGGHRALIFTQMSKMLDILESFLNLHGHTYLRLDGGTGVEKRQRLMDKFNNDTRVFCFILSTRSGGLGINLTGADTVIFYDSDWNPAMDAQAQDRAHRIGQTRDVHIYRLVTGHSIEENILIKAKQKRHLDFLVMDEGKFHATTTPAKAGHGSSAAKEEEKEAADEPDILSKGGLRDILGVAAARGDKLSEQQEVDDDGHPPPKQEEKNGKPSESRDEELSKEQIESAMASLEDEDDVRAMRGAQKEAEEELQEFDENVQYSEENGGEKGGGDGSQEDGRGVEEKRPNGAKKSGGKKKTSGTSKPSNKKGKETPSAENEDEAMEKEFAAWQNKVGVDTAAINASLTPMERYALNFREEKDPSEALHAFAEQQREEEDASMEDELDMEEIERSKTEEERRAIEDCDLLATQPPPEALPRQRQLYAREKSRLRAEKLRRKLTGENWETRIDGLSDLPFWFNADTGEARWDKPAVLIGLEAEALARERKWNAIPTKTLVRVMEYLVPFRDRMRCSAVCRHWRIAATDISFVKHVFPVEMGALAPEKLEKNHFRTIAEAVDKALPGDTIELGDGHYWVNEPGLCINIPIRLIGDENDPSHVVVELSGSIEFDGTSGWMEGVTLRRPRIVADMKQSCESLRVLDGGKFDMVHCVLDNEGNLGNVSRIAHSSKCRWEDVDIRGSCPRGCGISIEDRCQVELVQCRVSNNLGDGVRCKNDSTVMLRDCHIDENSGFGIYLSNQSHCLLAGTSLRNNDLGDKNTEEDGSTICAMAESNGDNASFSSIKL